MLMAFVAIVGTEDVMIMLCQGQCKGADCIPYTCFPALARRKKDDFNAFTDCVNVE